MFVMAPQMIVLIGRSRVRERKMRKKRKRERGMKEERYRVREGEEKSD